MNEPRAFCRAVMHEYERQWARAGGHAVRHPLKLKMEQLQRWCESSATPEEFERQLAQAHGSDEPGAYLLADELLPLWRETRASGHLTFNAE